MEPPPTADSSNPNEEQPIIHHHTQTKSQSQTQNTKTYRGIRMRKWGKWVAEIHEPNKRSCIWLGSYSSPIAIAHAYDTAVFYLCGPTTRLNFPDSIRDDSICLPLPYLQQPHHLLPLASLVNPKQKFKFHCSSNPIHTQVTIRIRPKLTQVRCSFLFTFVLFGEKFTGLHHHILPLASLENRFLHVNLSHLQIDYADCHICIKHRVVLGTTTRNISRFNNGSTSHILG
ncbi:hypothetical protein L6452_08551 [Arctium lappa]|uniref:Uncharacterized protein n=1 Tax=Arctium lappa TaxID=4217 RepID=A0ACB9DHK5_ARCLA|nr:hypothetical protein L6452_08551 [Arctium lappa]